jgi:hypothetical protein
MRKQCFYVITIFRLTLNSKINECDYIIMRVNFSVEKKNICVACDTILLVVSYCGYLMCM